jgi:hypothetical protein
MFSQKLLFLLPLPKKNVARRCTDPFVYKESKSTVFQKFLIDFYWLHA